MRADAATARRSRGWVLTASLPLALIGLALLAAAGSPATASAAEYGVEVCTPNSPAGDGIEATESSPAPFFFNPCNTALIGGLLQGTTGGIVPEGTAEAWTLSAPANTSIHTLELTSGFTAGRTFLEWSLATAGGTSLIGPFLDDGRVLPETKRATYTVNSTAVRSRLSCPSFAGHVCPSLPGSSFSISLASIDATLEDNAPPVVTVPGLPASPLHGIVKASFSASDAGSGIAGAALIVDEVRQPEVHDSNGGRCPEQPPYKFLVPCKLELSSSIPLDTTRLREGQHRLEIVVTDAAGQRAESAAVTFTVHNSPTNVTPPVISGVARVGEQLSATTGAWTGTSPEFAYQWLRCPATVTADGNITGCVPISGAATQQYAVGPDDVNQRDLVKVTARNAAGSASAVSVPSDVVANPPPPPTLPLLSRVSLSRKRFQVASGRTVAGRGTVLRLTSNELGSLTIAIERRRGAIFRTVAKLAANIKPGRSAVLLTGRIGRRRLAPGKYRVTITLQDALGALSAPVSLPCVVLRG